jgi:hypothetical protein
MTGGPASFRSHYLDLFRQQGSASILPQPPDSSWLLTSAPPHCALPSSRRSLGTQSLSRAQLLPATPELLGACSACSCRRGKGHQQGALPSRCRSPIAHGLRYHISVATATASPRRTSGDVHDLLRHLAHRSGHHQQPSSQQW